jgi:hypothetical protein
MPFLEGLKLKVKERANFTCCWCNNRDNKVQIHHIIPQEEEGPDTEDNAAPLCGSCHDKYGGNPQLRKEIRQRRDAWYQKCIIEEVKKDKEYSFQRIVNTDPIAALGLLQINLEYYLVSLASASYIMAKIDTTMQEIVAELTKKGAITLREESLLSKMIDILDFSARNKNVDAQSVDWAMEAGPKLLKALDTKLIMPYEIEF